MNLRNKPLIYSVVAVLVLIVAGFSIYYYENKPIELVTGEYKVGEDIPPGSYIVESPEKEAGNFTVYDVKRLESDPSLRNPRVIEAVGTGDGATVDKLHVRLAKGEEVVIKNISSFKLTKN